MHREKKQLYLCSCSFSLNTAGKVETANEGCAASDLEAVVLSGTQDCKSPRCDELDNVAVKLFCHRLPSLLHSGSSPENGKTGAEQPHRELRQMCLVGPEELDAALEDFLKNSHKATTKPGEMRQNRLSGNRTPSGTRRRKTTVSLGNTHEE
ncbi:hypothetical protein AGIG_G22693 [Arapaima gigas]